MADDETPNPSPPVTEGEPAPKKPRTRAKAEPAKAAPPAEKKKAPASSDDEGKEGAEVKPQPEEPRAPKRATIPAGSRRLLSLRDALDRRRPIFGRQAANRYYRIGRDGAWRRPRGLQSKQRRHYGYRPRVVRIGYRSPARVRGLVPSGFQPILVRTPKDLEAIDTKTQAAIIARTIGTRRRLVLEETARRLGIHVLNPIVKSESEG
jgi:large subunit ribosomal protein L32e